VLHNDIPADPIQGQGHECLKNWENVWFQSLSPRPVCMQ